MCILLLNFYDLVYEFGSTVIESLPHYFLIALLDFKVNRFSLSNHAIISTLVKCCGFC